MKRVVKIISGLLVMAGTSFALDIPDSQSIVSCKLGSDLNHIAEQVTFSIPTAVFYAGNTEKLPLIASLLKESDNGFIEAISYYQNTFSTGSTTDEGVISGKIRGDQFEVKLSILNLGEPQDVNIKWGQKESTAHCLVFNK